jgi:hypothetical protein
MTDTECQDGIYLVKPYGQLFANGNITSFVKTCKLDTQNRKLFICSGSEVYGMIEVVECDEVDIEGFNKLYVEHKVSDFYRKIWWGKIEKLYNYRFKTLQVFKTPIPYKYRNSKIGIVEHITLNGANGKENSQTV